MAIAARPGGAGRLAENIMHFARTLRAAGLPIGPGRVLNAIEAVLAAGLERRDDFYWTLHAVFVNRRDQRDLFDQAFHVFWRNPRLLERMMSLVLPPTRLDELAAAPERLSRRLAEALARPGDGGGERNREERVDFDAAMTWSRDELLARKDFESMSAAEVEEAIRAVRAMRLEALARPTRRFRPDPAGDKADLRRSLRAAVRSGADLIPLLHRRRERRPPPLVVLCDISGSMERYSRILLNFLHALANSGARVHSFLFGTRLTHITRLLRARDVDPALAKVGRAVEDWSGGTRIGQCLAVFNRTWSRRVLAQGAVVLLITDGLDRDEGVGLAAAMERLHKSCRRLVWLNPLLRFEGFEPKSLGVKAMLPHVDDFRPVHNLESLRQLGAALKEPGLRRLEPMAQWRERAA